ncbi:MAG: hypothetical protein WCO66_01525 [Candidatus Absconditabacteria bacterium]
MIDVIESSRKLMYKQTEINKAPARLLTEIAIKKGQELCKIYNIDETLVLVSLYLAHTVFSPIWDGETQKNHPELSAKFVKQYLDDWSVSKDDQLIILNAIEAHHNKIPTNSIVAEIVKNAECFKFISIEGSLIWLHELGLRQVPFDESVDKVIQKMGQKKQLLTLERCKLEAEINCNKILEIFSHLKKG